MDESMSHAKQLIGELILHDECRCNNCDHETLEDCIKGNCTCCNLEHAFYLQTGVDM